MILARVGSSSSPAGQVAQRPRASLNRVNSIQFVRFRLNLPAPVANAQAVEGVSSGGEGNADRISFGLGSDDQAGRNTQLERLLPC